MDWQPVNYPDMESVTPDGARSRKQIQMV